jgi:PAS domain-containing protein
MCLIFFTCGSSSFAAEATPAKSGLVLYSLTRSFTTDAIGFVVVQALLIMGLLWKRRRVIGSLRRSEALLRTITDHSHVGLAMLDADRRYIFASAAYAELLGLSTTNIVGKSVEEAIPQLYCRISAHLDEPSPVSVSAMSERCRASPAQTTREMTGFTR